MDIRQFDAYCMYTLVMCWYGVEAVQTVGSERHKASPNIYIMIQYLRINSNGETASDGKSAKPLSFQCGNYKQKTDHKCGERAARGPARN